MNKQQLASKIWESANKMRSKIEASEYKDYILGFIFYKYLSDKEVEYLKELGYTKEDLPSVTESDEEIKNDVQQSIGYFIDYKNLFSTWLAKRNDFSVADVREALSAFNRLICPTHKKVFSGIFITLETGLSKLGENTNSQTKAISDLLYLIKDIPMNDKQGYDVLGFIYEYLISNFAANAGKKAGEFYTPHEVALLMSEIVADHLKDKETISIYDPTSGSGSLLINIGKSVAKHMSNTDGIKYYAQELIANTYNLTRMNLIMRGILPDNIVTRNGDTLKDDWPYFDENNKFDSYEPLFLDAVVSNPPYSQLWEPLGKESDPRYSGYGLAPSSKADYAFLLHDLYHVNENGIMAIVLPHGVLFRGNEEENIRKNLVDNNKIDTIIGMPPNIFFGTGIPTIVMVLKQNKNNNDVLIIDASKGFIKVGKNNKLRASDIKRIADVVHERKSVEKFSKVVPIDEIKTNNYNLNIPRYVDSSEDAESYDIYATMNGGIPNVEIDNLAEYWLVFPQLKNQLFTNDGTPYSELKIDNVKNAIEQNKDVNKFKTNFNSAFSNLENYLIDELITNMSHVEVTKEEAILGNDLFNRLKNIPLIDKYNAYQLLDDSWQEISIDFDIINSEGKEAIKVVEPNMVIKKKDGKESEVQEGWKGRIIPFELVQENMLSDDLNKIKEKENRISEIACELEELISSLSAEDQKYLNDKNDAFDANAIKIEIDKAKNNIITDEIKVLKEYINLLDAKAKKNEKLDFITKHNEIDWSSIDASKDGTYSKNNVNNRIKKILDEYTFEEGSLNYIFATALALMAEEKEINKAIKEMKVALHIKTKETIESLSDEEANELLRLKWVMPLVNSILELPNSIIANLVKAVTNLSLKYSSTFVALEKEIDETQNEFGSMIDQLTGDDFDIKGLQQLKESLRSGK